MQIGDNLPGNNSVYCSDQQLCLCLSPTLSLSNYLSLTLFNSLQLSPLQLSPLQLSLLQLSPLQLSPLQLSRNNHIYWMFAVFTWTTTAARQTKKQNKTW